ncbi:restriction endonuclease subunit S [Prevotella copri]|nr:restriction endonuclease subunit S [Segatella copri]MCP9515187.1 restriction endonuclease subunit S [Segatella copri]MCP9517980.1 restriction endonuclease subunit S [Segatella copri]MCP9527419.1 restriction endonuclease subunit S [Segatella copri]
MQDVITFVNGRAYKKEELLPQGKYKVLRVGNFFTNNEWYYSDLELPEDKYCYNGDLLYAWSASFGPQIWNGDKTIFHYHIWNVKFNLMILFREYLYYFFLFDKTQVKASTTGSTMVHVSMENMKPRLIPIPPVNEQKRIVHEIENIIPLIERYGTFQNKKEILDSNIKAFLKKSILQEAIQGKLVPQIPEEGTAQELLEQIKTEKQKLVKEGKLKKSALNDSVIFRGDDNRYYEKIGKKCVDITEEIPFTIPTNWKWVRIRDVFQLNPKNEADDETLAAFIPMEKISAGYKSDFTFDLVKWGNIKKGFTHFANGDVAFAKITPCFQNRKSAIFHGLPNGIGAGTTELKVLRPYGNTIGRWYLLYFLESPYFIDEATFKGTANQQRIVVGYLENKLFPLPPKEEQQRIVAQIEKLFEQLH